MTSARDQSDRELAELLADAASGKLAAWVRLVTQVGLAFSRYAARRYPQLTQQEADDLSQVALQVLLKNARKFLTWPHARAYARTVIKRRGYRFLRSQGRLKACDTDGDGAIADAVKARRPRCVSLGELDSPPASVADSVSQLEMEDFYRAFLARICPEARSILSNLRNPTEQCNDFCAKLHISPSTYRRHKAALEAKFRSLLWPDARPARPNRRRTLRERGNEF